MAFLAVAVPLVGLAGPAAPARLGLIALAVWILAAGLAWLLVGRKAAPWEG